MLAPPQERTLSALKITEVATRAGPIIYRVDVLWRPGDWKHDSTHPTQSAARKRVHELQDGLNAYEGERVVFRWYNSMLPPEEAEGQE